MGAYRFSSYKHDKEQEILSQLRDSILVFKLALQDKLDDESLLDVHRTQLAEILNKLIKAVNALADESISDINLSYLGWADRFISRNDADVADRIFEIERLTEALHQSKLLKSRHLMLLDQLQYLLESETLEDIRGIYNF